MGHFLCVPIISGHRRDWGRHRLVEVSSLGYGYGNGYGMRQTHVWTLDSFPCELIMEGTQESEVSNCQRKFTWDETDTHWVSFLFADYASAQKRQTICRHKCGGHWVPFPLCAAGRHTAFHCYPPSYSSSCAMRRLSLIWMGVHIMCIKLE